MLLVLMLVIVLALFVLLGTGQLQQVQHLQDDSLEGSAQVLAAVGFI